MRRGTPAVLATDRCLVRSDAADMCARPGPPTLAYRTTAHAAGAGMSIRQPAQCRDGRRRRGQIQHPDDHVRDRFSGHARDSGGADVMDPALQRGTQHPGGSGPYSRYTDSVDGATRPEMWMTPVIHNGRFPSARSGKTTRIADGGSSYIVQIGSR